MFKPKRPRAVPPTKAAPADDAPQYAHPRILLIDCDEAVAVTLRKAGYNLSIGSFGKRYIVPNDGGWRPAIPIDDDMPGLSEAEVVIVDLTRVPLGQAPPLSQVGIGQDEAWVRCSSNILDPRPRTMLMHRELFDRILAHGGQFILFAGYRESETYCLGRLTFRSVDGGLDLSGSPFQVHDWSFLSWLDDLDVSRDDGNELYFVGSDAPLSRLLLRHMGKATFRATLKPFRRREHRDWGDLLHNKYGQAVAGVWHDAETNGTTLIVPDIRDKSGFLIGLLTEVLPDVNPSLFPDFEGARWVHRREYEMPGVLELESRVAETKRIAEQAVEELEAQIIRERSEHEHLYALLRGTGDELVQAVIITLRGLGFTKVVDVDALNENAKGGKREDVQIHDRSPVLVVDIKGVQGHPEDAESTQSEKHALMRIHEWERIDVTPLTIINHQRNLPPRDRYQQAYRTEIINNANKTGLGLMTTWDLWKLARNAERLNWPDWAVRDIFYRKGRIDPVPAHYVPIGGVVQVWSHAFGIVPAARVSIGDTLAIEVGDGFAEVVVESLRVNNSPVEHAEPGQNCGIGRAEPPIEIREDARVFMVEREK